MNQYFHLSLPCKDVQATRKFYEKELGFEIGRSSYTWFDVNIYQHQVTFTQDSNYTISTRNYKFEDQILPTFHFGIIIEIEPWTILLEKFRHKKYFATLPQTFLKNKIGEHQSFFILDPNGYYIEFKSFKKNTETFLHP